MRILVTGGTVFVSKYIAEFFSKRGNKVFVLNRNSRKQLPDVTLIECDRRNIGTKLKNLHFDVVIDVTAYNAEDINSFLDSLYNFDEYIMISSSAVYPETLEMPFREVQSCGANNYWGSYGLNKIKAESALKERVPHAYILRPPYLYGEYNNVYREAFVFDCAEKNMPFYLPKDGSMKLQFFHVEDLCRFIVALLNNKPERRIYNVGNRPVTIKEWVSKCYAVLGRTPEFISVEDGTPQRNYFPFYDYGYELDVTEQDKLLDSLLPLSEGLRRSYLWYVNNRNEVAKKSYLQYIERNLI